MQYLNAAFFSSETFRIGAGVSVAFLAVRGVWQHWHKQAVAPRAGGDDGESIDPVTGLANHAAFTRAVAARIEPGAACSLLLLDIDGFRAMRGICGRGGAEALLRQFGQRLQSHAGTGTVSARLDGDEFAVLLHTADETELQAACTRLLAALKPDYSYSGIEYHLSACIGAASINAATTSVDAAFNAASVDAALNAASVDAALNAASTALDQAKHAGPGQWRLLNAAQEAEAKLHNALKLEFTAALAAGQLIPYYQPIVELATGAVCGFEVLARWAHPRRGLLPPSEFIDIAEQQNLCGQLSLSLLQQVTEDQRDWPQNWRFAFNAAPGQLHELLNFVTVRSQMPKCMIAAHRIDLEITEHSFIRDLELARAVVRAMHAGGTQVVLDDFGTGYANFMHLREIPFDRLKIDQSFIRDMLTDNRCEACVHAILALGVSMGIAVTAEGVETPEAAARLKAMGCSHAQGYLYAPPLPAEAVAALARNPFYRAA